MTVDTVLDGSEGRMTDPTENETARKAETPSLITGGTVLIAAR